MSCQSEQLICLQGLGWEQIFPGVLSIKHTWLLGQVLPLLPCWLPLEERISQLCKEGGDSGVTGTGIAQHCMFTADPALSSGCVPCNF